MASGVGVEGLVKELKAIARRRLSGPLLVNALNCLSDEDVVKVAARKFRGDPFEPWLIRIFLYQRCIASCLGDHGGLDSD
jgi:hypothetical protein